MNDRNSLYGRWAALRDKMIAKGLDADQVDDARILFYTGACHAVNIMANFAAGELPWAIQMAKLAFEAQEFARELEQGVENRNQNPPSTPAAEALPSSAPANPSE